MTSKTIIPATTLRSARDAARRAFFCWPSRIGAASLVALALTCGVDALAPPTGAAVAMAANTGAR